MYRRPKHKLDQAVLVLAGRYMMAVGAQMQQLAAAENLESFMWLIQVVLGGSHPYRALLQTTSAVRVLVRCTA